MFQALALALGGLGIFLAGMHQSRESLKKLTGRPFKRLVAAWTRRRATGLVLGIAAGGVMQSTTAITFILASMTASGHLTVEATLPVIAGSNIGSTFLLLLANLDIRVVVLIALGLAGLSFIFDSLARFRTPLTVVFAIGLVFFGLNMLQSGVASETREAWFGTLVSLAGASYGIPFVAAIALTVLSQSRLSVILLAIALAVAGGLTFDQAVMAIYGTNLGSSGQTLLLSAHLRGRSKQVAMYQVLFNVCATAVLLPLFFVEHYGHVALVEALAKSLVARISLQLVVVQVIFSVVGTLIMLALAPWLGRFLERRFPVLPDEDDGRPVFINDYAVQEPEAALDLVELEQRRLASHLAKRLDLLRERPKNLTVLLDRQRDNFIMLSNEVHAFLRQLANAPFDVAGYDRLNSSINRLHQLDGLSDTLYELVKTAEQIDDDHRGRPLLDNIVEALDAVILTMVDALDDTTGEDKSLFRSMTRNRGNVMQRIREAYLAADASLSNTQKAGILVLTNLAERAFWLLGQLAEQDKVAA